MPLKYLNYAPRGNSPNVVAINDGGWKFDNSFYPFLLSTTKIRDSSIIKIEEVQKQIFWTKEKLNLYKHYVTGPGQVPRVADLSGGNVFEADIPYLMTYLLNTKQYVYKDVKELNIIVFDFETANTNLKEKTGDILCCGLIAATFNLETLKISNIRESMLSCDKMPPEEIVKALSKTFSESDLIIAHNIGFDYGVLSYNAKRFGVKIPASSKTKIFQGQFRGEYIDTPMYNSWFDTMIATDIAMQIVPGYGLKLLAEELKVAKTLKEIYEADGQPFKRIERTMVYTDVIKDEWARDPERVKEYCMDDVRDTLGLFKLFSTTCFVPAMQAGIPVDWIIVSGVKSIWETLLMRKCAEKGIAIPHFTTKAPKREGKYCNPNKCTYGGIKGARSSSLDNIDPNDIKRVIEKCHNIDLAAAYPNAMLQRRISPETVHKVDKNGMYTVEFDNGSAHVNVDEGGIMGEVLEPIVIATYELKAKSKKNKDLKDLYQGFKALRNSAFGFMGIEKGTGRFTNKYATALITQTIRDIIDAMIKEILRQGGKDRYKDTDGIYFTGDIDTKKIQDILDTYGEYFAGKLGASFDVEYFEKIFFVAGKNYLYLDHGEVKVKGSALVPNNYPKSTRKFSKEIIEKWLTKGEINIDEYIYTLNTTNAPDLFAFSVGINGKDYSSAEHKKLFDRFGYGKHRMYIAKNAPLRAKPYENYQSLESFKPAFVDRNWYIWHLKNYYLEGIIGLKLTSKDQKVFGEFDV